MKQSLPYEIFAALLALFGAVLLVVVFFPIINPGMASVQGDERTFIDCLWFSPIPILILSLSFFLNRKAQKLKRDGK